MKRMLALGMVAALSAAPAARGQLIAYESFTYPPGDLTGQNGGTGFSAPWTVPGGTATVLAGSLTPAAPANTLTTAGNSLSVATTNPTLAGRAVRTLSTPVVGTAGSVVWVGVVMKGNGSSGSSAQGSLTVSNGANSGFAISTGASGFGTPPNNPPANALWSLADASGVGGEASSTVSNSLQSLLVTRTTFGATNDVIDLFVNPPPGATPPASPDKSLTLPHTATYTTVQLAFANLAGSGATLFDEIRIGNSFAVVTGAAVPEPSTLLLAGAAGVGGVVVRRRRSRGASGCAARGSA